MNACLTNILRFQMALFRLTSHPGGALSQVMSK